MDLNIRHSKHCVDTDLHIKSDSSDFESDVELENDLEDIISEKSDNIKPLDEPNEFESRRKSVADFFEGRGTKPLTPRYACSKLLNGILIILIKKIFAYKF